MIRSANLLDTTAICEIYNHYVTHTIVTFEETAVSAAEMEERIRIISAKYPYLAWEDSEGINGYAYVNKWKERVAYRQTAELSIYVRNG
ncbi:MAG: GNAT family N-acetyltransferase, partial [Treponema sp.]|nr:GNAT family N-acetyltransferase [Treponema sp.]